MLDHLSIQGSTENPTFVMILLTVLLSFLLSSLIAFTYEKTSRDVVTPLIYLQALVLVAIVAATVMQAIGDSLARGLGMLGALAIIRFRTNIRNPRNMVFTFASLAAGISCGVYGFVIGITGTIGFCLAAFILKFSPMSRKGNSIGILKFELPKASRALEDLEDILSVYCCKYTRVNYRIIQPKQKKKIPALAEPSAGTLIPVSQEQNLVTSEKIIAYEYQLKLKKGMDAKSFDSAISKLSSLQSVKLNFESFTENI